MDLESLAGQVAWITGAGTGIGRATALAFAAAGCPVALTGRRRGPLGETAELVTKAGGTALVVPTDVTDPDAVTAAHAAVVEGLGEVRILVNDAGLNAKDRHWRNLGVPDMSAIVDVNLKGPFLCSMAVLPAMRARGGGTLIHVVSLAGTAIFVVSGPAYIAAKHGARAMSASLNAEEGIHGIRSICINPGEVATPLMDMRPIPPSKEARALMVQPEDIAAAALFAARLPPRTCIADMTVVPTDNNAHRAEARAIAGQA
jgi:NADP-dependent 3-hydroxy acid dehydrogenase YdfG